MKELKMCRRKRDSIFYISFYVNNKRTSLKTSNEMEAGIKFINITGLPISIKQSNGVPVINQEYQIDIPQDVEF